MKQVSIATWYYSKNFGTVLQAFALQRFLEKRGYNAMILNDFSLGKGGKSFIKNTLGRLGLLPYVKKLIHSKEKRLFKFFQKEIRIQNVFTYKQLQSLLSLTDVFLSGSDQIWNPYYDNFSLFYMLDFAKGKKKISYATSIGTDNFDTKDKEKIRLLLREYSFISTREDTAVYLLNNFLERNDVRQVVDPTFLLESEEWIKIGSTANYGISTLPDKYILCYLVGNNVAYAEQIRDVSLKTGIDKIIIVPSSESPNFMLSEGLILKDMGPREFVGLISKAELICTDSFHAIALSLNMSKNFVVFKRFKDDDKASQNSRIYSLLNHYGLMQTMYNQDSDALLPMDVMKKVQCQIADDRKESVDFLMNSIEN